MDWLQIQNLPSFTSWVAGIIGMRHHAHYFYPFNLSFSENLWTGLKMTLIFSSILIKIFRPFSHNGIIVTFLFKYTIWLVLCYLICSFSTLIEINWIFYGFIFISIVGLLVIHSLFSVFAPVFIISSFNLLLNTFKYFHITIYK